MLAEEVCDTKSSLGKLTEGLTVYPQLVKNVKVKDKEAVFNDEEVKKVFAEVEALIGGEGRALLRKSGTEPKIRVMIEALTEELCEEYADLRCCRLKTAIYPASVLAICAVTKSDLAKQQAEEEAIPEFKRFNIVESEVRNVI